LLRRYWKFRHSEIQQNLCYDENIQRLKDAVRAYNPDFSFPLKDEILTIEEIRKHYSAATKALSKCQENAEGHRIQCQYDLLAKYESDTDPATQEESKQKVKIVRRNIQGEETRGFFKILEASSCQDHQVAFKSCWYPVTKQPTHHHHPKRSEHFSATLQHKHFLVYNRQSFRAAADSPCGHGIIHDAMSFSSLTPAGEEILQGKVPPEWHGDNDILREFLASFAIPKNVKEAKAIKTEISEADFV
jgi:hypothetical protein